MSETDSGMESVCTFPMLIVKWMHWLPLGQQERAAPIILCSKLKWVLSNLLILPVCKVNIDFNSECPKENAELGHSKKDIYLRMLLVQIMKYQEKKGCTKT